MCLGETNGGSQPVGVEADICWIGGLPSLIRRWMVDHGVAPF